MSIRNSYEWYDIHVTFILNPLNWTIKYTTYFKVKQIKFGPVSVTLYYGS